jgi:hypothetical protein
MIKNMLIIMMTISFVLTIPHAVVHGSPEDVATPPTALERIAIMIEDKTLTVDWVSVQEAIQEIGMPETPPGISEESRTKDILGQILLRDAPLKVSSDARLPGVMPPLEMLKCAAIDALVRLDAREYVIEIQKVYESTQFAILKEKARAAIDYLQR